ncbi:MAG: class I SAM-dependent methyltransferase [Chloroflexota bacterium]
MRVDEPRLATDDLFGPLADEYEAWYATPLGAFVIALEERALLDALPDAVGRLIEIGAGTGWWTRTLARRGFTVTAVEPSAPMRRVGAARGQGPIEWLAGRAEQLPVPDDSFDVVLLMTVLEFVSGPERARRSTNSRQNPWYPYNAAPGSPPPRRCG